MKYMITLDYKSDAERKRIDYAIERWQKRIAVEKPKGVVIIVDSSEDRFKEFLEDILSRLEPNHERNVGVYLLNAAELNVEKKVKKLKYHVKASNDLKKFLDYLMAKLNAAFQYETEYSKVYIAHTKKGQARIEIRTGDCIVIIIEGYGNVVNFLADKIDEEMRLWM